MSDEQHDDFLTRTITLRSKNFTATRTRTSKGFGCITISAHATDCNKHRRTADFSTDEFGDDYEQRAGEFAKLLDDIATHSCLLPVQERTP